MFLLIYVTVNIKTVIP